MKKIVALMLALCMTLCAAAAMAEEKTYEIGICQLLQHPALDEATRGFRDALTEKLGDKVKFDEQNASGEAVNCATIVNTFVSNDVDLIMANATAPCRRPFPRPIPSRFWAPPSPITQRRWVRRSSTAPAASTCPVPAILRRWMDRRP